MGGLLLKDDGLLLNMRERIEHRLVGLHSLWQMYAQFHVLERACSSWFAPRAKDPSLSMRAYIAVPTD